MHVAMWIIAISHAQRIMCINSSVLAIGLASACKYNALLKFIYLVCLQLALMNVSLHAL